jgi:hypothetical protein
MKMLYANYKNIGLKHKRIFDGQGNCRLRRLMAPIGLSRIGYFIFLHLEQRFIYLFTGF